MLKDRLTHEQLRFQIAAKLGCQVKRSIVRRSMKIADQVACIGRLVDFLTELLLQIILAALTR
jgi:hypothetical protein